MYKVSYNFRTANIKHIKHIIMYIDPQITVSTNLSNVTANQRAGSNQGFLIALKSDNTPHWEYF